MQYHAHRFYAVLGYAAAMGALTYYLGWLLGLVVPITVNGPALINLSGGSASAAVVINLVLMAVFMVPHSIMARPSFKKKWM